MDEKITIGEIYLVFEGDDGHLDANFNWYVDLNEEEEIQVKEGLLMIQKGLFDAVYREERKLKGEEEKDGE